MKTILSIRYVVNTAILLAFILNSYALETMGVFYVSQGGAFILKLHAYTYLVIGYLIFFTIKYGLSFYLSGLGKYLNAWLLLLISIIYVIIFGLLKFGTSGMAYVVDTLLTPVLLFPLLMLLTTEQKLKISKLIMALLVLNSLVSVFEYVTHFRIFNYEFEEYQSYFRSTSFMSHPLSNALISASIALFLYNDQRFNSIYVFILTFTAIFAFGARTASLVFLIASLISIYYVYFKIRSNKSGINLNDLISMKISLFSGLFLISLLVIYFDFGKRIFENIAIDGSAQTRLDVFYVFDYLTYHEYLFGVDNDFFLDLIYFIDNAIVENFVIAWILNYGFVGSVPLILFFYFFLYVLYKNVNILSKIAVVSFIVISISNNSLAAKNPAFLYFLVAYTAVLPFSAKKRCIKIFSSYGVKSENII